MDYDDFARLASTRTNVSPRRLVAPGPDERQLADLLALAAAAPDHGQLAPWHFLLVPRDARERLGHAFSQALQQRDPLASADELAQAEGKAQRAPMLLIGIVRIAGEPGGDIPAFERLLAFGAAVQNILLGAHALGFGAGLTSGKAMNAQPMRSLCELQPEEQAICCVNIGTVTKARPPRENRKPPQELLRALPRAGAAGDR